MQVQSRRQSVAGNEEEDSPSSRRGNTRAMREADAAFWQLEWKVMSGKSGRDKTSHFLWFFSPHNGLFYQITRLFELEKRVKIDVLQLVCGGQQSSSQVEELWGPPTGDRNTVVWREMPNALPQLVYKQNCSLPSQEPLKIWNTGKLFSVRETRRLVPKWESSWKQTLDRCLRECFLQNFHLL